MTKRLAAASPSSAAALAAPTTGWTEAHLAAIADRPFPAIAPISAEWCDRRISGLDVWDMWPVEAEDGTTIQFAAGRLWMALAAPVLDDPEDRHAIARIHFLVEDAGGFRDTGPAFPDGHTPGSREWSGSAAFSAATNRLTCWFTASGRRGEETTSFEQRLFATHGKLEWRDAAPCVSDWSAPTELVRADGETYLCVKGSQGAAGTIKAFRDPAYFRDPASGVQILVFTGSDAQSTSPWNGVIGAAISLAGIDGPWHLLPPLISADGVNNELERPHLRYIDGLYYLFWSTQEKVFADGAPPAPTGLYGMVSASPLGPYAPLNDTGLIAANPPEAPWQAYSWWVLKDLSATSFVDLPGVARTMPLPDAATRRALFGGCPAPWLRLAFDGATSRILEPA